MKAVGFIFARGGSKGLPNKNIRFLAGKPLIAWAIEHALAVDRIEKVVVSTDSLEIAAIARHYGAEVPFIRPYELSRDNSPEWLAWRHALEYFRHTVGEIPEVMVSIPATAPLRLSIDIENSLDEYYKGGCDAVISVTEAHRNPYFNMVKKNIDGTVGLVNSPKGVVSRRQDAPIVFDITTICYTVRADFILSHNSIFDGQVRAVHVPIERAIDIDTLLDFQIAESLLKIREESYGKTEKAK